MANEKIIVSLTTWEKRIYTIPVVLNTIFNQTLPPDRVVLNLSEELIIPDDISNYLDKHNIEINRVKYEKVYKKLIPTLIKYPEDCIINIDDDWLYPPTMIEDFWNIHKQYPLNPISGNREFINGLPCHCGCASLTKSVFFGDLSLIDKEIMENCPSDDTVYTYFAARSGYPYIWTNNLYYTNLIPYNANNPYTESDLIFNAVGNSWNYLTSRFGKAPSILELFIKDKMISKIISRNHEFDESASKVEGIREIRSTMSYKLGHFLLKPFSLLFPSPHKKIMQ